jgi:hypothetical protein
MTNPYLLLGAALAAAQISDFPCDKLTGELLEVYDGFEAVPAPSPAAVEVRKKAVLFDRAVPLVAETFALADPSRAGGRLMVFRRFRSGDGILLCTHARSDTLFGAGDEALQFLLRCLADRDGDGAFEGFARRIPLLPADTPGRILLKPPAEAVETLPFARPIALVSKPGLADPNAPFKPKARTRIAVAGVRGNEVQLSFSGQLSMLPDYVAHRFEMPVSETFITMPMTEGGVVPVAGTRIRFAKRAGKWTATVLDGFGSEPRLLCSGSVAEVGDTFTILGAGSQQIIPRANLPGAH